MGVHNSPIFCSECADLQITGPGVKTHECVMLISAFIFDQLLLKVLVMQLVISQPLFWLYNNGELMKSYNLN